MEVAYWLEHKSRETMLIALTEGELHWDETARDFRWDETTPLPPALKGKFSYEPKWIDFRQWRDAPEIAETKFIEAGADLAAAVHGIPKEDLLSQEMRQQKRALRLAWSAAGVLFALAGLAAWQWAEAVQQGRIASEQRDRAERALAAATQTANTLVIDLANEFRDRRDMPSGLVRRILDRARELQQQLLNSGETSPALLESAGQALDLLVVTLLTLGENDAALQTAQRSREAMLTLVARDGKNVSWRRRLSVAHNKVGYVLLRAGRRTEAVAAYREALRIAEELSAIDPENEQWQRDVSVTLGLLAGALIVAGQRDEALAVYRRAHAFAERQAQAYPGAVSVQRDLAVSLEKIGDVLIETQEIEEALIAYRKSLAIREALVQADPDSAELQRDLSVSYDRLGDALHKRSDVAEAIETYTKSLAIRERLARGDPDSADRQQDLVISYNRIGDALLAMGRRTDALELLSQGARHR